MYILNDKKTSQEILSLPQCNGRAQIQLFEETMEGKGFSSSDGPLIDEQRAFAIKVFAQFCTAKAFEDKVQEETEILMKHIQEQSHKPVQIKRLFSLSLINSIWNLVMNSRFELDDPVALRVAEAMTV